MSARYDEPQVTVDEHGRLSVRVRVVNDSLLHWRGAVLGWQVTEGATHRYLEDGPVHDLGLDIGPGQSRECILEGSLPAADGRYRLFVAPLVPGLGWLHTSGGRALVLDVEVNSGKARLVRQRPSTMGELARRDLFSHVMRELDGVWQLHQPPRRMVEAVWTNRRLAWSLAKRDLAARYRGSAADALWMVIHPLLLMLTYLFVFGVVLRARFAGDPSTAGFALYFLAGMIPWLAVSEVIGRAPITLVEHRHFVKKLVFPVELLNVSHALSALVTQIVGLVLLCLLLFALRGSVPPTVLLLPLLIIPQLFLTVGVSWTLSALGVYLRDLGQIIGFLLTLLFFLTPICYPEESLPESLVWYFRRNPIYVLVRGWRALLLSGELPPARMLLLLYITSFALFFVGAHVYRKLRPTFADVL
ncbi:MAG: ABC transporter permease [Acidobacteriota bacterium]